jgi:hypothetical protein
VIGSLLRKAMKMRGSQHSGLLGVRSSVHLTEAARAQTFLGLINFDRYVFKTLTKPFNVTSLFSKTIALVSDSSRLLPNYLMLLPFSPRQLP